MSVELLSFLTISFFIAITPGPSVIYVVSYSLRYGAKSGVVSTLGINVGSIIFILIAAYGLSTLLELYPRAITVIQLVGGFYVIYLAISMWPKGSTLKIDNQSLTSASYRKLFINGVITSVLNPKDILFYTAFIPTFIPSTVVSDSYRSYFLMLAFSYMMIGFATKSLFAVFAGQSKVALNSKHAELINYISSIILLVLGLYLVASSLATGWAATQ